MTCRGAPRRALAVLYQSDFDRLLVDVRVFNSTHAGRLPAVADPREGR